MIEAHKFLFVSCAFFAPLLHYDTAQGLLPKMCANILGFHKSERETSL